MAERGKAEESQRTEAPGPISRDELQGVVEHLQAVFGHSAHVQFSYSVPAAGPSNVAVLIEAEPVLAKAKASEVQVVATAAVPSDLETDVAVERDDAYYDDVRQAVGRGAPSVLLGTSTKALDRGLQRIRSAKVPDEPSSSDVPPLVRPSSRPPSSPSPSSRIAVQVPVKRSSIWWKLAVTGIWAFVLLCTSSVISAPSHGWFQLFQSIAVLIFLWATAIVISVPRIRHGAKASIRKNFFPDRSDRPAQNEPRNEPSSERREWSVPPASPRK